MVTHDTAAFFHSYAHDFASIYGNDHGQLNRVLNGVFRKSMLLRYEKTLAGCVPAEGRTVIDIGCGPGHYSVALAERGARHVLGVDFAPGMIQLAERRAQQAGVSNRCQFVVGDFLAQPLAEPFDYAVVMGVMDYIAEPRTMIQQVLSVTRGKAFFSFPVAGGMLGWQRKLRYRRRCPLYLYEEHQVRRLFHGLGTTSVQIEKIARDFFVTATVSSAP